MGIRHEWIQNPDLVVGSTVVLFVLGTILALMVRPKKSAAAERIDRLNERLDEIAEDIAKGRGRRPSMD